MKWTVKITTDIGWLELPLGGYYKTKKEAEDVAKKAEAVPGTVKVEVLKK